ncbi:hypothetical protein V6N13_071491 [Hibiscus sabdariffa]
MVISYHQNGGLLSSAILLVFFSFPFPFLIHNLSQIAPKHKPRGRSLGKWVETGKKLIFCSLTAAYNQNPETIFLLKEYNSSQLCSSFGYNGYRLLGCSLTYF